MLTVTKNSSDVKQIIKYFLEKTVFTSECI